MPTASLKSCRDPAGLTCMGEIVRVLRPPSPRSSRRCKFYISAPRHGVINWEEFCGRNLVCHPTQQIKHENVPMIFGGSFCTANKARKCPNIRPSLRPIFALTPAQLRTICRRNFALQEYPEYGGTGCTGPTWTKLVPTWPSWTYLAKLVVILLCFAFLEKHL